jgi:hypothetical protein
MDACGRFPYYEFGLEPDDLRIRLVRGLDALDEVLRRGPSHLVKGLANGGEPRVVVLGNDDVVEADDGDVAGAVEACVFDSADGADGGGVVEAEDGGEVLRSCEEFTYGRVSESGRPGVVFEIDAEFRADDDTDLLCDADDGLPAHLRVTYEACTLHEGEATVAEVVEVTEGHLCSSIVIEHGVGNAGNLAVSRDADGRNGDFVVKLGVDGQEAVDGAVHQQVGILLDEVGTSEMAHCEVEEALLHEVLLDAEHDAGEVAFGEFGDDDADGVRKTRAQHAGVHVGSVVEFFGGCLDSLMGGLRDGLCDRGVVKYDRDSCGGEIKVLGEDFKGYRLTCVGWALLFLCHRSPGHMQCAFRQLYTLPSGSCDSQDLCSYIKVTMS